MEYMEIAMSMCHSFAPTSLDHLDAVARVELPTLELEGVALEVGVLEILVELGKPPVVMMTPLRAFDRLLLEPIIVYAPTISPWSQVLDEDARR